MPYENRYKEFTVSAKKILVVEDHKDTRELLKYNLVSAGFDVTATENGQSGLDLAAAFKPDIKIGRASCREGVCPYV